MTQPADSGVLDMLLPCRRKLETEADRIGLTLAAQACYDPRAFVPVMTKLGEAEAKAGYKTPEFLRTHPVSTTRIKQAGHHGCVMSSMLFCTDSLRQPSAGAAGWSNLAVPAVACC